MGRNPICIVCGKEIPIIAEQQHDEEGKVIVELFNYVSHWALLTKDAAAISIHDKCFEKNFEEINKHLLHPFKVKPR